MSDTKTTITRPPMFLFLVIKVTLVITPLAIIAGLAFSRLGFSDTAGMIMGAVLSWWIISKYNEILIEIVDYMREKYDQDPE